MEHAVKGFTVIDFLGYMGPGAVFLLALQFFTGWVTVPCQAFFGADGDAALAVYFIAASCFCGNYLHDIGAAIEPLFIRKNMHKSHWGKQTVCSTYKKLFCSAGQPGEDEIADICSSPQKQLKAGKTVFHYVQRNRRPQRLLLFHAFFVMGRTMFLTLILVILMSVVDLCIHQENTCRNVWIALACGVCAILSYLRWRRFEQKSVDEAYLLFTTIEQKEDATEAPES